MNLFVLHTRRESVFTCCRMLMLLISLVTANGSDPLSASEETRSFPTAEGVGAWSKGGRGGKIVFVTNLNDSGPGSLRAALDARHPRIVVFRVGGTIELKTHLDIRSPYITVAGQTAPGDGICLKNKGLGVTNSHDVVVRHLRVRPGGKKGGEEFDSVGVVNSHNVIFDHCSFSWGNDEVCSLVTSSGTILDRITIQWCIISECLDWYDHSMGSAIDSKGGVVTLHHNLFAHNGTRNPRIGAWPGHSIRADIRNNVIYNWRTWCGYSGGPDEGRIDVNYVGNYLKAGPSTRKTFAETAFLSGGNTTRVFSRGNQMHQYPDVSDVEMINIGRHGGSVLSQPVTIVKVKTDQAHVAYRRVLDLAGATLPKRDRVDARIVNHVTVATGKIIASQSEVGGWPNYRATTATPGIDADLDGMPTDWETLHGLDPGRADQNDDPDKDGYTNIEEFLNGTNPRQVGKDR